MSSSANVSRLSGNRNERSFLSGVSIARFACWWLVLVSIGYAAWRLGGTETSVQWQMAIGLSIALGLALITVDSPKAQLGRGSILPYLCAAWLLWAGLQSISLPIDLDRSLGLITGAPLVEESTAAAPVLPDGGANTLSVVPANSRVRWSIHVLAAVVFILGWTSFSSKWGRFCLLLGVAGNAAAISIWSIIQRGSNSSQVIPFDQSELLQSAFSTFRYRNAGGAYLLLGLAAAVGLAVWVLVEKNLWRFGGRRKSKKFDSYNRSGYWTDLSVVVAVSLVMLVAFAVLLSYSRGAWISGLFALALICVAGLRGIGWRSLTSLAVCSVVVITVGTYLIAQNVSVETRSSDLAIERISADDRFDHWKAGAATALHYFPLGSGLGTYGFAHIPFKQRDSDSWYRNAHNQYLEVLTESGVIGIAIVVSGIVVVGRRSWQVLTKSSDAGEVAVGAAGCVALITVACQSSVDFVITYPATLLTAGLIFGAVCGCSTSSASRSQAYETIAPTHKRRLAWPSQFGWLILLAPALLYGQFTLRRELELESTLAATEILADDVVPTQNQCTQNLDILKRLTDTMPNHAVAWQRFSWWQLTELRLQRSQRAGRENQAAVWEQQTPIHWFASLVTLPPQQRSQWLAQHFATQDDRQMLQAADQSLQRAVQCNPLSPQIHLGLASLAPAVGSHWQLWADRLSQLASANPEQTYAAGLLYYAANNSAEAIKQWNRNLAISGRQLDSILLLALQRWDAETIVNQLFPDNLDLLISMIAKAQHNETLAKTKGLWTQKCLRAVEASDTRYSAAERAAFRARVAEANGAWEQAGVLWTEAIREDSKEPSYRLRLASVYIRLDDEIAAYDQVIVGQTLGATASQAASLFTGIERLRERRAEKNRASQ